jgi:hypothetical protein
MKGSLIFIVILFFWDVQDTVKEIQPTEIKPLNLSTEGELKFLKDSELHAQVIRKIQKGMKPEQLSAEERRVWDETDETKSTYWDIIGDGCSWYCGGGPEKVAASSILEPQGSNSYDAENAHDFSFKSAWVEGVPGQGAGEYLLYTFSGDSPRITDVIVVNGYVKSDRAYLDNGRVKKLKMYINNEPYAILKLVDQRSEQRFKFAPIGNSNRIDQKQLKLSPDWTLKFEILEVYKGLKHDDVAITEIYFDGLDVH